MHATDILGCKQGSASIDGDDVCVLAEGVVNDAAGRRNGYGLIGIVSGRDFGQQNIARSIAQVGNEDGSKIRLDRGSVLQFDFSIIEP